MIKLTAFFDTSARSLSDLRIGDELTVTATLRVEALREIELGTSTDLEVEGTANGNSRIVGLTA